jgi:hypothetical protein
VNIEKNNFIKIRNVYVDISKIYLIQRTRDKCDPTIEILRINESRIEFKCNESGHEEYGIRTTYSKELNRFMDIFHRVLNLPIRDSSNYH